MMLISACSQSTISSDGNESNQGHGEQHQTANGDIQEQTNSVNQLPTFLDGESKQVIYAYQVAAKHIELLDHIPCYCGCSTSAGHKNNKNCFIKDVSKEGQITWDSHGVTCGVCQQIAIESAQLKKQGKSDFEIRSFIDSKYSRGFAEPTPTPLPKK